MKKRIIAALLVLVMTVLALASCGFDLAQEDLTSYTDGKFDIKAFMTALKNIEIEDGEYTTNADTNKLIIDSDIYNGIASGVITNIGTAGTDDNKDGKLEDGKIGATDVVYYCYYITYTDKDGVEHQFKRDQMDEAAIKASSTSASHVINLGKYTPKDKFATALAEALKATAEFKTYSSNNTKVNVKKTDTIAISYTLKVTEGDKVTTNKASYEFVDLSDANNELAVKLASYIGKDGTVFKVGDDKVKFPVDNYSNDNKTTTNSFVLESDGVKKEYSDIAVKFVVDKNCEPIKLSFKLESSLGKLEFDELHNTGAEVTSATLDKDTEVVYNIFPVYRVEVPESGAAAIIEHVYASKLESLLKTPASSFAYGSTVNKALNEVLQSEDFKNADKDMTAKELVEALVRIYKSDYSRNANLKALSEKASKANEELDKAIAAEKEAKTAWEKATEAADKETKKKAYDDAKAVTAAKQTETDKAEDALENAKKYAIKDMISMIVAAKKDDTTLADEMIKVLTEELEHSRKEAYDKDIQDKIKKEVYKLVDESVKVTSYPEKLVDEFYDHIYDSYEYTFYNGNYTASGSSTSTQSNYSYYKGDFDAFLMAQTKAKDKDGIKDAITKEAQNYIEPLIKVYVVAKALDSYDFGGGKTADALLKEFVQKDIELGLPGYKAYPFANESLSDKENADYAAKLEENAEAARENALEIAEHFFIDKEGFKAYKKSLGAKSYRYQEQTYGETNLKANLQISNLFDLLLSANQSVTVDNDEQHVHTEINYVDGLLDYRLIEYSIVEDKAEDKAE